MEHRNGPDGTLPEAISRLQVFSGADLTGTLTQIDRSLQGISVNGYSGILSACGAKPEVLSAAGAFDHGLTATTLLCMYIGNGRYHD